MKLLFISILVLALVCFTLAGGRRRQMRGGRRRGGIGSHSSHSSSLSSSRSSDSSTDTSEDTSVEDTASISRGGRGRTRLRDARFRGRPIGNGRRIGVGRFWRNRPIFYACQLTQNGTTLRSRNCPPKTDTAVSCTGNTLNVTINDKPATFTFCNYTYNSKPRYQQYINVMLKKACKVSKVNPRGATVGTFRSNCRCIRRKSECVGGPIVIPFIRRWKRHLYFCKKTNGSFDPLTIFGRDKDDDIDESIDETSSESEDKTDEVDTDDETSSNSEDKTDDNETDNVTSVPPRDTDKDDTSTVVTDNDNTDEIDIDNDETSTVDSINGDRSTIVTNNGDTGNIDTDNQETSTVKLRNDDASTVATSPDDTDEIDTGDVDTGGVDTGIIDKGISDGINDGDVIITDG